MARGVHTFTHVSKPDVDELAGALAVDSLELVRTNDGVAKCRAISEDEHGVVAAGIGIGIARAAAIKLSVAHVLGAGDGAGLRERNDAANTGGDVERLRGAERGQDRGEGGDFELHSGEWLNDLDRRWRRGLSVELYGTGGRLKSFIFAESRLNGPPRIYAKLITLYKRISDATKKLDAPDILRN